MTPTRCGEAASIQRVEVNPLHPMFVPSRADLRRLHFINALFGHVTGHDLYLAQQIKDGIAFSLAELEEQMRTHPEFAEKFLNS